MHNGRVSNKKPIPLPILSMYGKHMVSQVTQLLCFCETEWMNISSIWSLFCQFLIKKKLFVYFFLNYGVRFEKIQKIT